MRLKKPITITLPNGNPYELVIDAKAYGAMHRSFFFRELGYVHAGLGYVDAARKLFREGARWGEIRALPRRYRRALIREFVRVWYAIKLEWMSVTYKTEPPKPKSIDAKLS